MILATFAGSISSGAAFLPLKNPDVFRDVYIDYGVPVWKNGDIDIAPEFLYDHGIIAENAQNA